MPSVLPDSSGRTAEHASESSIHVALVTEPGLKRDGTQRFRGLPQAARRALDTQSRRGLLRTFSYCLHVCRSDPGGMSACLDRELANFSARVLPEVSRDRANPARWLTRGLQASPFKEPSNPIAQTRPRRGRLASASKISRRSADGASDPLHDGQTWKPPGSDPGWVKLDLDLFESNRGGGVAMTCAGAIEDRRWPGDKFRPDLGLVQIRADHEKRENGPVVSVLGHAGVAPVNDPSDTGSAEALQHQFPIFQDNATAYINVAGANRQEFRNGRPLPTLNSSNTGTRGIP
jgi:hypothetical protein